MTLPHWLDRTLYPFSPRRFETDEGVLSYVDVGTGPPVLLVHGTPSYSLEWRAVIAALATAHRVIAPDHLGFGLSDKPGPTGKLRVADHQRRLRALFDHLELDGVTLVVHDFGGPIGLPLALDRKERIARVVVLNSWMWPVGEEHGVKRIDRLVRSALGRWLYLSYNFSPRVLLPSSLGEKRRLTAALHAQYLGPFPTPHDRAALLALAEELGGADATYEALWKRRGELTQPLAIVWGQADPAFGPAHLTRWREAFPAATVTTLPGVGHFVAEEAPHEVVRAIDQAVRCDAPAPLAPRRSPVVWAAAALVALSVAVAAAWQLL